MVLMGRSLLGVKLKELAKRADRSVNGDSVAPDFVGCYSVAVVGDVRVSGLDSPAGLLNILVVELDSPVGLLNTRVVELDSPAGMSYTHVVVMDIRAGLMDILAGLLDTSPDLLDGPVDVLDMLIEYTVTVGAGTRVVAHSGYSHSKRSVAYIEELAARAHLQWVKLVHHYQHHRRHRHKFEAHS